MMRTIIPSVYFILIAVLVSCQSAAPIATSTPQGQIETQVAATIYTDQTSIAAAEIANQTPTAAAKQSPFHAALTADALTAAVRTPIPISSVQKYEVSVPASACWMNSSVEVLTGQRVMISASGTVNTWDGREGSSNNPDGQTGMCGAIECPLQGAGYGALIGRLEDLKPFYVGSNNEFVATKDGQLHFTVNDWKCEDNSGVFDLIITIP